jgi:hypothetical protein
VTSWGRVVAVAHLGLIALLALITFTPSPVDGATRSYLNAGTLSRCLRPASQAEITRCEVAARSVDLDVLCPSVLPKGQYDDPWCEDTKESPCAFARDNCFEQEAPCADYYRHGAKQVTFAQPKALPNP